MGWLLAFLTGLVVDAFLLWAAVSGAISEGLAWSLFVGLACCLGLMLAFLAWTHRACVRFYASRVKWQVRQRAPSWIGGAVELVTNPTSPTSERKLRFTTNNEHRRLVETAPSKSPVGIRFTSPAEKNVTAAPANLTHCGRLILRVVEFHPTGIVVGDQLPGVVILAEVSYLHER